MHAVSLIDWIDLCVVLVRAGAEVDTFVYGLIRYPDLPIRECPSGYCGKQGQPRTAAEYRAFNTWQITLMIGFPIGIAAMLFLQHKKSKDSK
jgi:hypothetical protein